MSGHTQLLLASSKVADVCVCVCLYVCVRWQFFLSCFITADGMGGSAV